MKLTGKAKTIKFLLKKHIEHHGILYRDFVSQRKDYAKCIGSKGTINGLIQEYTDSHMCHHIIQSAFSWPSSRLGAQKWSLVSKHWQDLCSQLKTV